MLIDEIKKVNIEAMKEKDSVKRAILSVVITKYNNLAIELKGKDKEITDNDLVSILQKTKKELEEERISCEEAGRGDKIKDIDYQYACIKPYIPEMLEAEEIEEIIKGLEDKSVPSVMKHFKTNYAGRVDMGVVNYVLKNYFNSSNK